jgi:hypothetical protein
VKLARLAMGTVPRLLPFVRVFIGCRRVATCVPGPSLGLRNLVYAT